MFASGRKRTIAVLLAAALLCSPVAASRQACCTCLDAAATNATVADAPSATELGMGCCGGDRAEGACCCCAPSNGDASCGCAPESNDAPTPTTDGVPVAHEIDISLAASETIFCEPPHLSLDVLHAVPRCRLATSPQILFCVWRL